MAKNHIFSTGAKINYEPKYFGVKKPYYAPRVKRDLIRTSKTGTQTKYRAIMETIPKSERNNARETYSSDEIFEIGEDIVATGSYKIAVDKFEEKLLQKRREIEEARRRRLQL